MTADVDAYEVLGVPPDASQEALKAAHRALVRRHHPDLVMPHERAAATRRVQEINVAYGLVRDPRRRAAYDRARAGHGRLDDLVVAAGRWGGRWWSANRAAMRHTARTVRVSAGAARRRGGRAALDAVGRVAWLGLCALAAALGWLAAVTAGRLVGVDGWMAPLAGALAGLAAGHRRGWRLRLRLARLPARLPGGALDVVAVAALIAAALLLDAQLP